MDNKLLNYEDPILSNEIFKQMKELKQDLINEGIAVAHANFDESDPEIGSGKRYYPLDKYGYQTSDEYGIPEMKGRYFMTRNPNTRDNQKYFQNYPKGIENMPGVNVPMTPTLDNYFTMGEEASHAYNYLNPEENQRIKGNMKTLGPIASLTARTDEEFIAKDMAKKMIGGYATPDTQALIDYTKKSYIDRLMQDIYATQYQYDRANERDKNYQNLTFRVPFGFKPFFAHLATGAENARYNRINDAYDAIGTTPKELALDVFSDRYPEFFNDEEFLNYKPELKEMNILNRTFSPSYKPYEHPSESNYLNYTLTDEDIAGFQTYEDFLKNKSPGATNE